MFFPALSFLDQLYHIAKESFQMGANPIVIDNTNMQSWEMRPYVIQVSQFACSTEHIIPPEYGLMLI